MEKTRAHRGSVALALACAGMTPLALLAADPTPITGNNQGVTFVQTSFNYSTSSADNARPTTTGMVSVNLASLNAALNTNFTSGYLNVADGAGGWLVQNLPVKTADLGVDATVLSLGNVNGAVNTLSAKITFSADPLRAAPTVDAKDFGVGQTTVNAQGQSNNPAQPSNLNPKPASPAVGAVTFPATGGKVQASYVPTMPNVQAADNQCGTAAVANALSYMGTRGLSGTYVNVPGRGSILGTVALVNDPVPAGGGPTVSDIPVLRDTPVYQAPDSRAGVDPVTMMPFQLPTAPASGVQVPAGMNNVSFATPPTAQYLASEKAGASLVGQLDLFAGRVSDNRPKFFYRAFESPGAPIVDGNQGTSPQQQLAAAERYIAQDATATKQIQITYQVDTDYTSLVDPNVAGITPADKSAADGSGGTNVTFDFILQALADRKAVVLGRDGHATDVVAAGYTLDQPWIVMQSDFDQTPNDSLDNTVGFGNGLEFSYVLIAANGDLSLPGVEGAPRIHDVIAFSIPEPGILGVALLCGGLALARRARRS